jgi:aminodeoxyfutalosine deaminase
MFDTDLTRDYDAARSLGVEPRACYEAGLLGALCDQQTKSRLRGIGEATDWPATTATLVTMRTDDAHGTG